MKYVHPIAILTIICLSLCLPMYAYAQNHVLSLDGDGDFVEIVNSEVLDDIGSQVTMEAWIRPTAFPAHWPYILFKGDEEIPYFHNRSYSLCTNRDGFVRLTPWPALHSPSDLVTLNTWVHIAGIIDTIKRTTHLFLNGIEVARGDCRTNIYVSKLPLRIGWAHKEMYLDQSFFAGQMDDVRIWSVARTQEQIQRTMYQRPTGQDTGLVGYWDFEGTEELVTDASGHAHQGMLIDDAKRILMQLPDDVVPPCVVTGTVQDAEGKPVLNALVRLQQEHEVVAEGYTRVDGSYQLVTPILGTYDLYATYETQGALRENVVLRSGQNRWNPILKSVVSIEGTALALDGETPHIGLVVQAILPQDNDNPTSPRVAATVLTDQEGKYLFVSLKPGRYQVRSYIPGEYVFYGNTATPETLIVRSGETHTEIDFHLPRFKKGTWRRYDNSDGLASMGMYTIFQDMDGFLWFGSCNGQGVSRFDGQEFMPLTMADGLPDNIVFTIAQTQDGALWFDASRYQDGRFRIFSTEVGLVDDSYSDNMWAIHCDSQGMLWFSPYGAGVSRYDGDTFVGLTTRDGLVSDFVFAIHEDPDGSLWFGTQEGVSHYSGERFTNFTTEDGLTHNRVNGICRDTEGRLWVATYGGVSRYDGGQFTNFTMRDGLPRNDVRAVNVDNEGKVWFGTSKGISCYDGQGFINFPATEFGFDSLSAEAIHADLDGSLWFGTVSHGVYRYDPTSFSTLTTADGLAHDEVRDSYQESNGILWLATSGGVSRYDGRHVTNLTVRDGLAHNRIQDIIQDRQGNLWFGTRGGVSSYDGTTFTNFTIRDGLTHNLIQEMTQDRQGNLWFATWTGVSSYDGKAFTNFGTKDGLLKPVVNSVHADTAGSLWFGTWNGGVSRYDGESFTSFTMEQGLAGNVVFAIHQSSDGYLWFGTRQGVSYYDGNRFTTFTTDDGLTAGVVSTIYEDVDGIVWFGTQGGGISGYDGTSWTSLNTEDGLADNYVFGIDPGQGSSLLVSTRKGMTRYRRGQVCPRMQIVSVHARETHTQLDALPSITTGTRVTFRYNAIDFKTRPAMRQYRWRIRELGEEWEKPSKSDMADFVPDSVGSYTFEVQTIDRDLNYSETASVVLTVVHPFYLRASFLVPTVGGGTLLIVVSIVLGVGYIRRRRQVHAYERYAAQELQDARQMQMSLMPEHAPNIQGAEIAGKCVTANTVGGDFFSYLPGKSPHAVGLVVADVSGKAMRGAMNAVMADGIVSAVLEETDEWLPGPLMTSVNQVLTVRMESDMNVTMVIALLDTQAMTLTLANAAHHAYPLLVRDGEVMKLKSRGLPLGMRASVQYREETSDLGSGDILVLMTDGCDTKSCQYLCCLWCESLGHRTTPGVLPPVPYQGMRREQSRGVKPLGQCSLIDKMAA